jgi:hypothetical protein
MLQLFRTESNGASRVEETVVEEHAGHPYMHHTCHNDRQQLHKVCFGYNESHSISTLYFLGRGKTFKLLKLTTSEALTNKVSLNKKTIIRLHEIMVTQCADRELYLLIIYYYLA